MTSFRERSSRGALRLFGARILESFWFVPLLMGISGALAAFLVLGVHHTLGSLGLLVGEHVTLDQSAGRLILSTAASVTISAASVVYSLSLLIRVLAASALGPRLVQSFRRSPITRIALGAQLATFIYSLVTLYLAGLFDTLHTLQVLVSIAGVVVAVALLVIFVNAIADQSTVDQIVGRIAGDLDAVIERRLRRDYGARPPDPPQPALEGPLVRAAGDGYVQVIDYAAIAREPALGGRTIQLLVRPGDFAIGAQPLARFDGGSVAAAAADALRRHVVLGAERTVEQDPIQEFNLLLEVALRALSPSINDVFTAIACTHHLTGAIGRLDGAGLTEPAVAIPGGAEVRPRPVPFAEIVDRVLDPLRNDAAVIPMMALVILDCLETLIATSADAGARRLYRRHADRVLADALLHADRKADLDDLKARGARIAKLSSLEPVEATEHFVQRRLSAGPAARR